MSDFLKNTLNMTITHCWTSAFPVLRHMQMANWQVIPLYDLNHKSQWLKLAVTFYYVIYTWTDADQTILYQNKCMSST